MMTEATAILRDKIGYVSCLPINNETYRYINKLSVYIILP